MQVNQTYRNLQNNTIFRIIAIEEGLVYYLPLFQKQSYSLKVIKQKELLEQLHKGECIVVDDPFRSSKEIKYDGKNAEKANQNWEWMNELWGKYKNELLNRSTRTRTIKEFARSKNCSFSKISRLLANFFERGMNKNAVTPNYQHVDVYNPDLSPKTGLKTKTPTPKTSEVEDIFKKCYHKYFLSLQAVTIAEAYEQMIEHYFKSTQKPAPSYLQFWRWIKKQDRETELKAKESEKTFKLKHRALTGSTRAETNGPGEVFELDATILDCHIVSRSNRNLVIGRPVLYLIIDRYSRMITGMNVGLIGPSWMGAVAALENIAADKVEYCKRFNIEISESDWPVSGCFPAKIVGDRGEMICSYSDQLIDNNFADVNNTPPYRGDLKPNVERRFGMVNSKICSFIDGAILKEHRSRGDQDPRDKARLNLEEITAVCIRCVLAINKRMIPKFPLSEDQIVYNVAPVPLEMWNYGVSHYLHALKKVDMQTLHRGLLPRKKCTVTREGIRFHNLVYTAPDEETKNWLLNHKKDKFDFAYDPADMSEGYLLTPSGDMRLVLSSAFTSFRGMSLEELAFYKEEQKKIIAAYKDFDIENRIELNNSLTKINTSAPKLDPSVSKASRKKEMRENRKKERISSAETSEPDQVIFVDRQDPLSDYDEIIEQVLKEAGFTDEES